MPRRWCRTARAEHMKTFGRVAVKCIAAPPKIEVITPEKVDVR